MSNAFIVFFLLTMSVSASVLGQKVSIDMSDATLEECIKAIESQTDLGFFYKVRQVRKVDGISITAYDEMVDDVLDELLSGTTLTYQLSKGVILIKPKPVVRRASKPVNVPVQESTLAKLKKVTGTVTDEDGQTLPGATIREKGTTNGVAADENGKFEIEVQDNNAVLIISFLGYETVEVAVGSSTTIDVSLVLALNELEEAVVIGYGTSKKKDLTGSVVRISEKAFESSSFTDMGQILQGQVAGMEIVSGNGRPGDQVRIRIRGESSLQGDASPLIVIDEVPMPDNYDLNLINPNDIQNIDILKGASAAAIYGSKGSAGVVLITTKQGKEGTAEVFYNGNISIQQYSNKIQGLNAEQYKTLLMRESIYDWVGKSVWYVENYNRNPYYYGDMRQYGYFHRVFDPTYFEDSDTDWSEVLTQNPINNNHTLGIRGGNKEASYYASFGYTDNKGIIINNFSKRLSLNLNLDIRPTKWFEMGFRVNGSKNPVSNTGDYSLIWTQRPDIPVYNEDGSYYRYYSVGHSRYRDNALQLAEKAPSLSDNLSYTLSGYGRIVFSKNLRYQATYSYSESKGESSRFTPSYTYAGSGGYYGGVSGIRNSTSSYSNQINFDNALHYAFTNEIHDVSAMIGTTFNQDKAGYVSAEFQDFPDDYIQNVEYNAT
ncbi:MAG: SusC/RagA family TonB-linked outer membrane protein, partial [Marinilabiliaceae bacterium]|nr:SusC/RagA family TonB-linked outer membrane protein [Marinilabiliaceae bacterium]